MYAITQKNGYYGAVSNAAGAWWGGLAAVIAGIITVVHLDKEWALAAGVINLAAFGVLLAGAVIDGIMAVQFWGNTAMCIILNGNIAPTSTAASTGVAGATAFYARTVLGFTNLAQVNSILNTLGSPSALIDKFFTNTNQNTDLYKWYALLCGYYTTNGGGAANTASIANQAANLFNQNNNQVYCVTNGFDNLVNLDPFTRQNQYCYQISTQSPLGINDLSRILPVLQASVAFNVIPAVTCLISAIIALWAYTWIHPADNQGGPMLVGIEPKGLLPPSPLAPPYPALPPLPATLPKAALPPPAAAAAAPKAGKDDKKAGKEDKKAGKDAPSASKIDLKPLGKIK